MFGRFVQIFSVIPAANDCRQRAYFSEKRSGYRPLSVAPL